MPLAGLQGRAVTIDEAIAYWGEQADKACTKELALVAFGIHAGLRMAKADHAHGQSVDDGGKNG